MFPLVVALVVLSVYLDNGHRPLFEEHIVYENIYFVMNTHKL